MRVAAQSRSADDDQSAQTSAAALPPSSSVTCLCGTASRIAWPTGPDPVNETTGSRGSATSAGARSSGTSNTDTAPAGSSVSAKISPSNSADSGVLGAGLTTIGAPTATAGAILCATRLSGKLNGEMPSTGPRGKRRTSARRPVAAGSVSRRCTSPLHRRASSAAQRNVETPRATSTADHFSGLPDSAVISAATSSARAASCALTWSSAAARTWAGTAATSALRRGGCRDRSLDLRLGRPRAPRAPAGRRAGCGPRDWTRGRPRCEEVCCGFRGKESLSHRIPSQYRGRHD